MIFVAGYPPSAFGQAEQVRVTITPLTALVGPDRETPFGRIIFEIKFSGSVSGFTIDDIVVSGTANNGNPVASDLRRLPQRVVEFTVQRGASDGTVEVYVPEGVATHQGLNGEIIENARSNTVFGTLRNEGPKVRLTADVEDNGRSTALIINYTAQFDADVSGFMLDDIRVNVENGTPRVFNVKEVSRDRIAPYNE